MKTIRFPLSYLLAFMSDVIQIVDEDEVDEYEVVLSEASVPSDKRSVCFTLGHCVEVEDDLPGESSRRCEYDPDDYLYHE